MELWDAQDYSGLDGRLNNFLAGRNATPTFQSFEGDFDYFDDAVDSIDFGKIDAKSKDFQSIFQQVKNKLERTQGVKNDSFVKPVIPVFKSSTIPFEDKNKITKVVIPRDKTVIVENVSKFILSQGKKDEALRRIGYDKKGNKLKELNLSISNNTETNFLINLFDPSMPLNYLYSTSQNINNRVSVQGGLIQYTDVLFNLLANPILIHNAYITIDGATNVALEKQITQPFQFQNKNLQGHVLIDPVNLALTLDTMQVANNIVSFNFEDSIGRPYIPDGMDVINYTIYPHSTISATFFYEQISLKKVFYEEARNSKKLL
jgi:hypothetical protein